MDRVDDGMNNETLRQLFSTRSLASHRFDSEKDSDLFARLVLVLANCEAGSPLT
jgi:hypothetical protein